jgi:hypothetical protein
VRLAAISLRRAYMHAGKKPAHRYEGRCHCRRGRGARHQQIAMGRPPPAAHGRSIESIDGTISQAAGMQSWIRDLIDLKTQISVCKVCIV